MLDLVEGAKIIQALVPTTVGANYDGDYISMKNAHAVWTIVSLNDGTSEVTLTPKTASAYAGTGAAAVDGGCQIWYNVNTTNLDRMTKSTATTVQRRLPLRPVEWQCIISLNLAILVINR